MTAIAAPIDATRVEAAMRRALALAERGPAVGDNPQVGCVLLDASGAIVAEGWHRGAGTAHAEVDALSKVADARGLTAVVTLEPCNHTGRTGPCALALIDAGVARVIYALADPSELASGGAERLRAAGIVTERGPLADEAEELLRPWLASARLGRPFVTVKWASTLDGRAAAADGTSQWITGAAARQRVHEQRARHDAIAVGTGTVLADDPSLTARGDGGELLAHQPIPVVFGATPVPADAALRDHPAGLIEVGHRDLAAALPDLLSRGIRRLYVEGGPTLASAFLRAGLADEVLVYLAPMLLGGPRTALDDLGVSTMAEAHRLSIRSIETLGDDLLVTCRPLPRDSAPTAPHS
ncbi:MULTISPECIES: bifunctional diaminohydroxyphosphoribosylaminopyrimidine deaminase/5-amino-6-(5-phosphoribosylamino)uracil reductase RibD [unclassified Microcella]|uniref:bifunctional diaminohydroxyphosphoribosylaminopyrimidine deaminase/5-amino-6-(5-phosphoribosylamino)uracil reductase RibD n=1 Tax=unclassified Microcella TaxID=2630066 RepID=UPI0006F84B5B|nr:MULTISPECIES: bifunctional diaminohydroxyphosphoribosylaminopyrimidine deaminase/5-amino-6-(5-phosphoribosylamino)uracil reductase RibD [unclassified Microcella]KQV25545.1 bifunctional diaminohydroxyphosphoribosylaminopyrimidine deaminase/5-amino-6-(5-phosphoribosylamino)uracil reductase [Yonghaparkia sp. Root332]KRF33647.1 bifunctional diaminohydroxyphosphoribosylaminopyrimidine deaminase/5-amino-6-(5-phosphoribosylamino)uracil reductase [Yonghaparkia sp. Soil809]